MSKKESENTSKAIDTYYFDSLYFAYFILLPCIYFTKLIDPVLIPRQLFTSIFLAVVILLIASKTKSKKITADFSFFKLRLPQTLMLFIAISVISALQATSITESLYVISKFATELLFFIVTTFLIIANKLSIKSLIKSIIWFCSIAVLISLWQMIMQSLSHEGLIQNIHLVKSTFANKNLLASILFLALPFLIIFLASSNRHKLFVKVVILLSVFTIILIKSRSAIIALLIGSVIYYTFQFSNKLLNRKQVFREFLITIFSVIIIYSLTILFASIKISNETPLLSNSNSLQIATKQNLSIVTNSHTAETRLKLWDNSLQMVKEHLVFGVGPGNWQIYFPKYGLDKFDLKEIRDGLTTFQRPHNDFLWILCETGALGLFTYLLGFYFVIIYIFKLVKNNSNNKDYKMYVAFLSCIVGYSFISLVDFPFERIEHQIVLMLVFSIVTANYFKSYGSKMSNETAIIIKPFALLVAFLFPSIFSIAACAKRFSGEIHTHKLIEYHSNNNWTQMIVEADNANNTFYNMDPMSAPLSWYKGVANFSLGNTELAQTSFEEAYIVHPFNIHVLNNLASCYESTLQHKKAEEYYLKALEISSSFEEARLNLSAVYFNTKKIDLAFETINKCDFKSDNPKYYKEYLPVILNSWIQLRIENEKDANLKSKLIETIMNGKLVEKYFESKKQNITFEQFIKSK